TAGEQVHKSIRGVSTHNPIVRSEADELGRLSRIVLFALIRSGLDRIVNPTCTYREPVPAPTEAAPAERDLATHLVRRPLLGFSSDSRADLHVILRPAQRLTSCE